MRLSGKVSINAPRQRVWQFLTDPHSLSQCAPGLESIEVIVPNQKFRLVASIGFGAVKATFVTSAEWMDFDPPNRARMKAHGTAPGSVVDASSEMVLSDATGGGTELEWTAEVSVVGTIASLASRLMGVVSQKLTDAFFDCVRKKIEAH